MGYPGWCCLHTTIPYPHYHTCLPGLDFGGPHLPFPTPGGRAGLLLPPAVPTLTPTHGLPTLPFDCIVRYSSQRPPRPFCAGISGLAPGTGGQHSVMPTGVSGCCYKTPFPVCQTGTTPGPSCLLGPRHCSSAVPTFVETDTPPPPLLAENLIPPPPCHLPQFPLLFSAFTCGQFWYRPQCHSGTHYHPTQHDPSFILPPLLVTRRWLVPVVARSFVPARLVIPQTLILGPFPTYWCGHRCPQAAGMVVALFYRPPDRT